MPKYVKSPLFNKDASKQTLVDNSIVDNSLSLHTMLENCKDKPFTGQICKVDVSGYTIDQFKTFDPNGYTILCRLGESCDAINYFPGSAKIVINVGEQSHITSILEDFGPGLSKDLLISENAAIQKATDFFSDKSIIVQPVGVQGKVYNAMRKTQDISSIHQLSRALNSINLHGMRGVAIVQKAPMTFIGVTYVTAMAFAYFSAVAGDNAVGLTFYYTSYVLSRPMWGVELVANSLVLKPVSNLIGLPMVVNGTQTMLNGEGLPVREYAKIGAAYKRLVESNWFKKARKIAQIIGSKEMKD